MNPQHTCAIGSLTIGAGSLVLIAGPCVAESLQLCLDVASEMADVCGNLGIGYIFKASYDKANRSIAESFRGPGLQRGLDWLSTVREKIGVPVTCDVHDPSQVAAAAGVLDCIQIPAFLCRQTDLLVEAGRTGKAVNVKKGQFMAPWDMEQAVRKIRDAGADNVLLTERGSSFGYNRLINDFCGIPIMQAFAPVVFDATHSVQEPGALGASSGGRREHAPLLAAAAMAAGADALFVETHPDPPAAKSDAASMIPLAEMESLLSRCLAIFSAARRE
jgi:2-dehydro-3-deoxyphosphooctonate aldolase (KDO 8-P synthase)